jgi:hypothetical protein
MLMSGTTQGPSSIAPASLMPAREAQPLYVPVDEGNVVDKRG